MRTILFITTLLSGLLAGLFYAYSCSVIPAFRRLPDLEYIRSMQAINLAIQNGWFFLSFMGLLVLFPLSIGVTWKQGPWWVLAAAALYLVGVFCVTVALNVPLNEQLARASTTASADELRAIRDVFENPWNAYHTIRTWASIASFGLMVFACLRGKSIA